MRTVLFKVFDLQELSSNSRSEIAFWAQNGQCIIYTVGDPVDDCVSNDIMKISRNSDDSKKAKIGEKVLIKF